MQSLICEATIKVSDATVQRTPRPQESLWSFDVMLGSLVILTLIFFFLTIYSILQSNEAFLPTSIERFLILKFLDTPSAASLFVTLVGALLVRHQFVVGLVPRINYKSAESSRTHHALPASFKTWRVEIRNSGLGAAVIDRAEYLLELSDAKENFSTGSYQDIVNELKEIGLQCDHDYWLEKIATGFALSPKEDCFAFEIKSEHLAKIKRLDMTLYFQSQIGGKYLREIFFIPNKNYKIEKQDV